MAKVAELKFKFNKENYKVPVNVGVSGLFKASLPREVADKLNIKTELSAEKLSDLEHNFFEILKRYKQAETKQFLYLAIRYGCSGVYNKDSEDNNLFFEMSSKYKIDNWNDDVDKIAFEFRVVMMESVDGVEKWYNTDQLESGEFIQRTNFYNGSDKWKIIPYDENCHKTLSKAEEGLRKISETLFNFMEQETDQLILSLSNNILLLNA